MYTPKPKYMILIRPTPTYPPSAVRIHGCQNRGVSTYREAASTVASHSLIEGCEFWGNSSSGLSMSFALNVRGNIFRDHAAAGGIFVSGQFPFDFSMGTANVFERNFAGGISGQLWRDVLFRQKEALFRQNDPATWPAIADWWAVQSSSALAGLPGWVFTPAAFDLTVSPGDDIQAAVARCPPGGSVLLSPGIYERPLRLMRGKSVRIFGQGQAILRAVVEVVNPGEVVLDGLVLRKGIVLQRGSPRLQACDIANPSGHCVSLQFGDTRDILSPVLVGCR